MSRFRLAEVLWLEREDGSVESEQESHDRGAPNALQMCYPWLITLGFDGNIRGKAKGAQRCIRTEDVVCQPALSLCIVFRAKG